MNTAVMPMKCRYPNRCSAVRADEQQLAVLVDESLLDQVPQDGLGAAVERREPVPRLRPEPAADPVFLQAQGQQLLGDDVPRLRRRHHRLDVSLAPQVQQPGGPQQRARAQCEEQAVAAAPGPPSGPADPLQERGHASAGR